jgi:hypothetical protein
LMFTSRAVSSVTSLVSTAFTNSAMYPFYMKAVEESVPAHRVARARRSLASFSGSMLSGWRRR